MRRIGRHLFTILAAASLLLCLAVLADWCTHPWRTNLYGWKYDRSTPLEPLGRAVVLGSRDGVLELELYPFRVHRGQRDDFGLYYRATGPDTASIPTDSWLKRRGFLFVHVTDAESHDVYLATLPSWFLATLFAILPAVRIRAILRDRRRNRVGLCPTCGYDLRAHAAGERCPECGMAVGR